MGLEWFPTRHELAMLMSLEHPELDSLAAELTQLMVDGGVRLSLLEHCPELLGLCCVHELAAGDGEPELAIAAEQIVKQALQLLGPGPRADVAQTLFAVAAGTKGVTTAARRSQAAQLWGGDNHPGVSVAHFRKHLEAPLIRDLAYEMLKLNKLSRLQAAAHASNGEWSSGSIDAEIDGMPAWRHKMMLQRQPTYFRIWAALTDLWHFLDAWHATEDEGEREDYAHASLHAYVRFMIAVRELNERWGGLWVLPQAEQEIAAAETVRDVLTSSPFGPIEESELRTTLDVLTHQEIAPWIAFLEADEHGARLLRMWQAVL